jgi:hypothetical protein
MKKNPLSEKDIANLKKWLEDVDLESIRFGSAFQLQTQFRPESVL